MGIRRKILLGLISIGILLLLSGIISTLELTHFKHSTYEMMESNKANIELTNIMLDALQKQNTYLLKKISDKDPRNYSSDISSQKIIMEQALDRASRQFMESEQINRLVRANEQYNKIVDAATDSTSLVWFSEEYKPYHNNLSKAITDFMVGEQQNIIAQTTELESQAYRATMVGIIALAAGLILVIMFYYMINKYITSPIISMQKSLHQHLNLHTPFSTQVITKDEMLTLRNDINRLIEKSKK